MLVLPRSASGRGCFAACPGGIGLSYVLASSHEVIDTILPAAVCTGGYGARYCVLARNPSLAIPSLSIMPLPRIPGVLRKKCVLDEGAGEGWEKAPNPSQAFSLVWESVVENVRC